MKGSREGGRLKNTRNMANHCHNRGLFHGAVPKIQKLLMFGRFEDRLLAIPPPFAPRLM